MYRNIQEAKVLQSTIGQTLMTTTTTMLQLQIWSIA